jgi:BirA family biotin operon repressor/biotin-[acetyl-CoA-carboxylase] ligase
MVQADGNRQGLFRIRLQVLEECDSTQNVLKEMAANGEPEGAAVMALVQTRGRGSLAREWVSPPGKNLALSVLLRPKIEVKFAPLLGLMACAAVAEGIENISGLRTTVKWPNDTLINDKKVAGILSEADFRAGRLEYVIVGIGVNVNTEQADLPQELRAPATSMLIETGAHFDLNDTASLLLEKFSILYRRVQSTGPWFIRDLWTQRWAHKGRQMTRRGVTGTAMGIDDAGSLLVRTRNGDILTSGSEPFRAFEE